MNDKKTIFAVIATGSLSFLGTCLLTGLNIAIPIIIREYHISTDIGQLVNSGYSMMVGILILMSTYLISRFSTPKLFNSAIFLFIVGLLTSGFAPNFGILLLGRLITGIASGIAISLMFNIILAKVPTNRRGLMIGLGTLLVTMGPAIGPVYGSVILQTFGVSSLFFFMLIIVLTSLVLGYFTIDPIFKSQKVKLDWLSVLLLVIILSAFTFGLSFLGSNQINIFVPIAGIISSIIFAILLFHRSQNIMNPILNVNIFKNSNFRNQNMAFFLSQVTAPAVSFSLSIYIQTINLHSAFVASMVIFPGSLISALLAPIGGNLLDKFGAKKIIGVGAAFFTIGLLIFWLVSSQQMNSWIALIINMIFMIGMGLSTGNLQTSGVNTLKHAEQSNGDAFFNASQQYSGGVGTALVGMIISAFQNNQPKIDLLKNTHLGISWSFLALLILAIVSDLLLLKSFKVPKSSAK